MKLTKGYVRNFVEDFGYLVVGIGAAFLLQSFVVLSGDKL